jgi:serine/threonine protein kinase
VRPATHAPHEAKYHHFFQGRSDVFWFKSSHDVALVYPWRAGKTVNYFKANELLSIPFMNRLFALTNFLAEVNTLHQLLRVHNDIKGANAVYDQQQHKIELIDFGNAKKIQSSQDYQKDMDDIYRLINALFPGVNKGSSSLEKDVIRKLLSAINPPDNKISSCTSEQAWQYCKRVVEESRTLSAEKLNTIASETIFREECTLEDVIRGRLYM